jgi:acyl-homoserine-lactone acylase
MLRFYSKALALCSVSLFSILTLFAQINPQDVTIARDEYGVPHIFGKTDADAAYGLAWAHSEDDFKNIQYNVLAGKKMLGRVLGKEGVLFDFGLQFLKIDSTVEANYEKDISPEYKKVLSGYVQGLNAYAVAHPKEVLYRKAFPVTEKDLLKGSVLQTSLMAGVGLSLKSIKENRIQEFYAINDIGSNAIAIAPSHTEDGKTWLSINSHQPLEGRFAWYEAHIQSEEGWDIIGGLFPGGTTIFVGTNKYLGWAHTVNYHSFGDVYKIEINPKNKNQYKYDGEWNNFRKRVVKLKVKIAGLRIGVKKKVLDTEYGPTYKNKEGLYAIRFPSYHNIRATDEWYHMNKATNFAEFEAAVKIKALPLFNIVYGDVDGNIYLHSGGNVPMRDPKLDWSQPIAGVSSKYKWTDIVPYEKMPTVKNPDCGYLYNCNNTPLLCTGDECEWGGDFIGIHKFNYNRGERMRHLFEEKEGTYSWEDFHRIKFDKFYHSDSSASYRSHFKTLYSLDEKKYPDIADAIQKLKRWNLEGQPDNREAALALVTHNYLSKKLDVPFAFLMLSRKPIEESVFVESLRYAKKFLIKTHGSIDVPLGDVQKHIRGDVSFPASGLSEVPRAASSVLHDKKKGIYKINHGDGYIQMVKFSKAGVEINSINCYGESAHPDSPHYTDQMKLFSEEKFKPMTFEKEEILKKAEKVYHPNSN